MGRLVDLETGQLATGERQPQRLNRVLVGNNGADTPSMFDAEIVDNRLHPPGYVGDRLRGKVEIGGLSEVGLDLTRKPGGELLPADSRPARSEQPLRQPIVGCGLYARRDSYRPSGLDCPLERGAHDGVNLCLAKSYRSCSSLSTAGSTEAIAVQGGVDDVIGVANLAVPDEVKGV